MQGVILAAGKGTRLDPLTRTRSKAMLPVLGKPIVARIMEDLEACGVGEYVIVVGPDDREIVPYFRSDSTTAARIKFVTQRQPLGMADALSCAAPEITGDFVLSACDNLVDRPDIGRVVDAWRESPSLNAVLAVMQVPPDKVSRSGIVETNGRWITKIVEKPALDEAPSNIASLPLYCFPRSFLDLLAAVEPSPRGERELQDAIQTTIERNGRVRAISVPHRLTLTDPADLLTINLRYLAREDELAALSSPEAGPNSRLVTPLYVDQDVQIGAGCEIGPNVYLERGCRIGDGARVRNSLVLRDSVVAVGQTVEGQIVSGTDVIPAT
jgi:NDP-sugar pyrophosphorylase family protein